MVLTTVSSSEDYAVDVDVYIDEVFPRWTNTQINAIALYQNGVQVGTSAGTYSKNLKYNGTNVLKVDKMYNAHTFQILLLSSVLPNGDYDISLRYKANNIETYYTIPIRVAVP